MDDLAFLKNFSLVMRAAANKPNINIVAVNDPFIPVDYSEYSS